MSDAPERTLEPTAADEPTITGTAAARGLTLVEMAEQLAGALRGAGADLLYGVPGGGANLDMVGAAESAGCRFVLTHTETAAAIMAGVTAELTGQPSALVVTRGPGAASAVNGAAQALLDRQPIVVITDCVTIADRQRVSHQRLDQGAMMGAATKASLCLGPHDTVPRRPWSWPWPPAAAPGRSTWTSTRRLPRRCPTSADGSGTPQTPLRRAYEQRPAEVRRWLRQAYPAIVAQARREKGASIIWPSTRKAPTPSRVACSVATTTRSDHSISASLGWNAALASAT